MILTFLACAFFEVRLIACEPAGVWVRNVQECNQLFKVINRRGVLSRKTGVWVTRFELSNKQCTHAA